jgi:hypothetical protein
MLRVEMRLEGCKKELLRIRMDEFEAFFLKAEEKIVPNEGT